MNYFYTIIFIIIFFSCDKKENITEKIRQNFSVEEQKIIDVSKQIIKNAYFSTLITVDKKGHPRARVMEPFAPDKNFIIWLATNPKSRKVTQIQNNATATLHYYDKTNFGYVSLYGKAFLVNDETIKAHKFKKGWDKFYKNQKEAYLLIKFVPENLELISIPNKYIGDAMTWKPHQVILR
jgi:general stress protein 26